MTNTDFKIGEHVEWRGEYYFIEFVGKIEMDHIVPVVEGGGSCGIDNLRTVCSWCHREQTKLLAGRRAAQRRKCE